MPQGFLQLILDSCFSSHSCSSHFICCRVFLFEYSKVLLIVCGSGGVSSPHQEYSLSGGSALPQRGPKTQPHSQAQEPDQRLESSRLLPYPLQMFPLPTTTSASGPTTHPGTKAQTQASVPTPLSHPKCHQVVWILPQKQPLWPPTFFSPSPLPLSYSSSFIASLKYITATPNGPPL